MTSSLKTANGVEPGWDLVATPLMPPDVLKFFERGILNLINLKPGIAVHAFNLSTWETEAGTLVYIVRFRTARTTERLLLKK